MIDLDYVLNTVFAKQMCTCTISSYHIVKRMLLTLYTCLCLLHITKGHADHMIAVTHDVLYCSD